MSEKDKIVIDTDTNKESPDAFKAKVLARRRNRDYQGKQYIDPNLKDPNYVYRWVNHSTDFSNIPDRLDLGYELVHDKSLAGNSSITDKTGLGSVVSKQAGHGLTSVLMRIRKDIYEEGQAIKAKAPQDMERTLKNIPGLNSETTLTQSKDNSID